MAATARSKADKVEHFDAPDVLERKVDEVVGWIRSAKHFTVFTGAGISTACGIPDFRSGFDTKVKTGAGVWECKAAGKTKASKVSTIQCRPSSTHMALVALADAGLLKAVISQNTDGLHARSGLARGKNLFELHGNSTVETCKKCEREFIRDFRTRRAGNKVHDHKTDRSCPFCPSNPPLRDSIINFGENLPDSQFGPAEDHCEKSDLCLALGSSLTVTPAADLPESVGAKPSGRLVICNLQPTPLDRVASHRLNGFTDQVMGMIMAKLGIPIPEWRLSRKVEVVGEAPAKLRVRGVSTNGGPVTLFKSVALYPAKGKEPVKKGSAVPDGFVLDLPAKKEALKLACQTHGHLGEGVLTLPAEPGVYTCVHVDGDNWNVTRD